MKALLIAFLTSFISFAAFGAPKGVCERSAPVRELFEERFDKHCSDIEASDLAGLEKEALRVIYTSTHSTRGEKLKKGDFAGVKARLVQFEIWEDLQIEPGVFDSASVKEISLFEGHPSSGARPRLSIPAGLFSGLDLESLTLSFLSLSIAQGAFANLKVKNLEFLISDGILYEPSHLIFGTHAFSDLKAEALTIKYFAKAQLIFGEGLFKNAEIRKLAIEGHIPDYRIKVKVFDGARIHWVKLSDLKLDVRDQKTLAKVYPTIRFSF